MRATAPEILRRALLGAAAQAGAIAAVARAGPASPPAAEVTEQDRALLRRLTGTDPIRSARLRLIMPPAFSNGYTVPLLLQVESAMTEAEHVRRVHVLAPKNPIVLVASFSFTPAGGRARVSTRIRLAAPQTVLATAEMSDGAVLMDSAWVQVDSNGCA